MQGQQKLELIDIYDITYEPWWQSLWFKTIGISLIAILSGLFVYYLYKKYRKVTSLTYWQQAFASIAVLEKQGFADGQLFYVRLTHIIKDYLHERYQLALADKTDTELLETLKQTTEVPSTVCQEVKEIFDGVIFIKFANQQAAHERMEQALVKSRSLIKETQQESEKK